MLGLRFLEEVCVQTIITKSMLHIHFQQALPILQYSLELCESHLDPDSLKIAWIMEDLGKLHFLSGRCEYVPFFFVYDCILNRKKDITE